MKLSAAIKYLDNIPIDKPVSVKDAYWIKKLPEELYSRLPNDIKEKLRIFKRRYRKYCKGSFCYVDRMLLADCLPLQDGEWIIDKLLDEIIQEKDVASLIEAEREAASR